MRPIDRAMEIPSTPARDYTPPARPDQSLGLPAAEQIAIPYGVIVFSGWRYKVDASYIRIVTDFPVVVKADGRILSPIVPTRSEFPGTTGVNPYEAEDLIWFNVNPPNARLQSIEYELFRQVEILEIEAPPSSVVATSDASANTLIGQNEIFGQVHVYLGREGVCRVGPGAWNYAGVLGVVVQPPGLSATFGPVDFCLHQRRNGGVGTSSGKQYQPAEVELLDFSFRSSQGCPIQRVIIYYRNASGTRDFQLWTAQPWYLFNNQVTGWPLPNIRVPNWAYRKHGAADATGVYIEVAYTTFCQLDDVAFHLNFRGR